MNSESTSDKLHCLASINPFHNGHLALFQRGLENAAGIDLTIGRKQRPHRIPWEVRNEAIRIALERADIGDRVRTLTMPKQDIVPEQYNGALVGSNLLCSLVGLGEKQMHDYEVAWFRRFRRFVVAERKDGQVTPAVLERVVQFAECKVVQTNYGNMSASLLRSLLRDGQSICDHLPDGVWGTIQPHIETLKLGSR